MFFLLIIKKKLFSWPDSNILISRQEITVAADACPCLFTIHYGGNVRAAFRKLLIFPRFFKAHLAEIIENGWKTNSESFRELRAYAEGVGASNKWEQ